MLILDTNRHRSSHRPFWWCVSLLCAFLHVFQATVNQNTRIMEESKLMEEELVAVLDEKDRLEERLGPAGDQETLEGLIGLNPASELAELWQGRDWGKWRGVRLSAAGRVLGLALSDRRIAKLPQIIRQLQSLELLHLDYNGIKVRRRARPVRTIHTRRRPLITYFLFPPPFGFLP